MLLGGAEVKAVRIDTPARVVYEAEIEDTKRTDNSVSCAVRKDAGDDPDITDKILIYATVSLIDDGRKSVVIEGGEGVGVITRPGLDQPVGHAAINSVPRAMIMKCVREVMEAYDCEDSLRVVISVPAGRALAGKTLGPKLGIVGGISILGTSGIVEPMSSRALLEAIRVELRQLREEGAASVVVAPGNYGLEFMRKTFDYDLNKAVKCSNYIGETIDMVRELRFDRMLLVGHVGKLIKLSGGIMNTHAKEADCRMELMAAAALRSGASVRTVKAVLDSVTTEEAYEHLVSEGIGKACFAYIMQRIAYYLKKRAGDHLDVQCIIYANSYGLLGATASAAEMLPSVRRD